MGAVSAFDRAWRNFNNAAEEGCRQTRPQFASLVLKAPELFKPYIVKAAKVYLQPERALSRVSYRLKTRDTGKPVCGNTRSRWACTLPPDHDGDCSWQRPASPRRYGDGS